MQFELTEEQKMVQTMVRKFAEDEIIPKIKQYERDRSFPFEIIKKMAPLGLLGGVAPQEYGGLGVDWITHAIIAEELSHASFSICLTISIVQTALVEMSILNWGDERQKQKYLPRLITGDIIGCFGTVEPNVGSDGAAIETTAVVSNDDWVLNGSKMWITNGTVADLAIITAQTDKSKGSRGISAFLVEKGTPGFLARRIEGTAGLHSADLASLSFVDCRIPRENILGSVGEGFNLALSSINHARYTIAAGCTGIAQSCLDASIRYAQGRQQFGRPIGSFQLIQGMIADMVVETKAARLLTYQVGYLKDKGLPYIEETSIAKYYATEIALRASINAMRLHGAYGYSDDFVVERNYRDTFGPIIFGGTNEIQKLIIGRNALGISAFAP